MKLFRVKKLRFDPSSGKKLPDLSGINFLELVAHYFLFCRKFNALFERFFEQFKPVDPFKKPESVFFRRSTR